MLGNCDFIHKKSLVRFHDGLAWLMQIVMFLTLGLLVFPTRLVPIAPTGLVVSLFLILLARPLSVFLSLALSALSTREKALVSWVGLRGAVPIILATFPLLAGVDKADAFFNLVFFIVLTSGLLQGPLIPPLARWLGVEAPAVVRPRYSLEFVATGGTPSELIELTLPPGSALVGKQVVELGLPAGALIVLIHRNQDVIVPSGGTVLEPGDTLLVLASGAELDRIRALVGG